MGVVPGIDEGLGLRDAGQRAQVHAADKWQNQDRSRCGSLNSFAVFLLTSQLLPWNFPCKIGAHLMCLCILLLSQ